jgi:hypothetical protein
MTLPEKIAAGLATDAEVAEALGFYRAYPHDTLLNGWKWHTPDGRWLPELPPIQTCLTTLAKECERRNVRWIKDHRTGGLMIIARRPDSFTDYWFRTDDTAKGDTLALCAALVAAEMEKNDDR